MVIKVQPESLRAASAELDTQASGVGGARNEINALGWLADPAAQEGLAGLVAAFGAAFEVLIEDMNFMSRQISTAANSYETLDGHVLPQYRKQVEQRRDQRLHNPLPPGA